MRFLHIADLHIGRRLGGIGLAEDQRHVLDQIVGMAGECDAVLIAGDVYNRSRPGGDAVRMAGDFLSELSRLGKPVFMISGNHDGGELVDYCGEIMGRSGIHACGSYEGEVPRYALWDAFGEVHIHLLPFVKPIQVRAALRGVMDVSAIENYEDAVRAALSRVRLDPSARNVLVAHQFVSGATVSESEERAIGGLEEIPVELFQDFDYVALGHLHSPQRLGGGRVCYSGSPLKYSLSEENQRKGALIVELGRKGALTVEARPFDVLRDLRPVSGTLAELTEPSLSSGDFIGAVVTDELAPPDPLGALRTVYPNLIHMALRNSYTNEEYKIEDIELAEEKGPLEHFVDFFTLQNNQTPPDERRVQIIREIIMRIGGDVHAAD